MTDVWISLVNETNWIGHPFNHITPFSSLMVTDHDSMLSIDEAISRGWLDGLWTTMDNETKETHTVGLSSLKADDLYLRPGSMYKVTTHVDQLGLIIHAYTNVPEPSSFLSLVFGLGGAGGMMLRRKR
ncbi:MAG: PEP-CTERM sorting domain-containing protein [Armatimonadota bacterium]